MVLGRNTACFAGTRNRCRGLRGESGQSVVELVVALPVILTVAVIGINAGLFFEKCASFDRTFSQTVRVCAAAPCSNQAQSNICNDIEQKLTDYYAGQELTVSVTASADAKGNITYNATVEMQPTLFGFSLESGVLCAKLPTLKHQTSLALSVYKPGVIV